jgi:hypothetical protein
MNERRDYIWDSVVPADLVLLAGLLAYLAFAIGAQGPMAITGDDDANRAAVDAWFQIPLHVGVAALLVAGAPTGRPYLRQLGGVCIGLLLLWMAVLTVGVLSQVGSYTDLGDVGILAAILACYGIAAYFTYRSGW